MCRIYGALLLERQYNCNYIVFSLVYKHLKIRFVGFSRRLMQRTHWSFNLMYNCETLTLLLLFHQNGSSAGSMLVLVLISEPVQWLLRTSCFSTVTGHQNMDFSSAASCYLASLAAHQWSGATLEPVFRATASWRQWKPEERFQIVALAWNRSWKHISVFVLIVFDKGAGEKLDSA